MSNLHVDLGELNKHDPKGFIPAVNNTFPVKDELGLSFYEERMHLPKAINFVDGTAPAPTTADGNIYVLTGSGTEDPSWGTAVFGDWVRFINNLATPITPLEGYLCYDSTASAWKEFDGTVWAAHVSGGANLSEGATTNTTVDVDSDSGTNATLLAASASRAGVMTKAKFDEVVLNNAKITFPEAPNDGTQYARKDLGWEAVAGSNLYTADGTLAAARTVTMAGFGLNFEGGQTTFKGAGNGAGTIGLLVENSDGDIGFRVDDNGKNTINTATPYVFNGGTSDFTVKVNTATQGRALAAFLDGNGDPAFLVGVGSAAVGGVPTTTTTFTVKASGTQVRPIHIKDNNGNTSFLQFQDDTKGGIITQIGLGSSLNGAARTIAGWCVLRASTTTGAALEIESGVAPTGGSLKSGIIWNESGVFNLYGAGLTVAQGVTTLNGAGSTSGTSALVAKNLAGTTLIDVDNAGTLDVGGRHLINADGSYTWGSTSNAGKISWDTGKALIYGQASQALHLGSNNNPNHVVIDTAGDVGIGTASPSEKLDIQGRAYLLNQTAPSTPTGGGVLYVESGALKYIGTSGTITTLGVA